MHGVTYAGSLILLMVGVFFLMFNAHVLQMPLGTFFRPIVIGIAALGLLSIVGVLYVSVIPVDSVPMLIASGGTDLNSVWGSCTSARVKRR
jgi:hypothetical protein